MSRGNGFDLVKAPDVEFVDGVDAENLIRCQSLKCSSNLSALRLYLRNSPSPGRA